MTGRICVVAIGIALVALTGSGRADVPDRERLDELRSLRDAMNQKRAEGAIYPAIEIAERRLALLRDTYDDDSIQVTTAMHVLADLHQTAGAYDRAISIYERVVAILEASETADAAALSRALNRLASAHWAHQRFAEAEPVFERALEVSRDAHGDRSAEVARALRVYGSFLWGRHAYTAAEGAFLRSFCILLELHGRGSAHLVGPLISLAWMHSIRGEETRALAYVREIGRMADGEEDYPGQRIALLSSAGALYRQFGFEEKWRAVERELVDHYRKEVDAVSREHGDDAAELLGPLGSLAGVLMRAERWEKAESVYRRLIAIAESHHDEDGAQTVGFRHTLASTLYQAGKYDEAVAILEDVARHYRARHRPEVAMGPDMMLAESHLRAGRPGEARALLGRTARSIRQTFGPEHPHLAYLLERRGVAAIAAGDARRALADLERAFAIHEPNIELILAAGTEADNQAYFRQTAHHLDLAVTLNARHAPDSARAARFGYTTVIRRKGRVLDTAAGAIERVRDELGEEGDELLDELSAARSRLAALIIAGPEATGEHAYRRELMRLETEVRRLEQAVRAKSTTFRTDTRPVELGAVQDAIPQGAALVEIVLYQPLRPGAGPGRSERTRYAAYVVGDGGAPELVDLGPAQPIDRAIRRFRRALADPARDVESSGRRLYDLAFAPLEEALGTRREILLAPDAALNLIPFGALVDTGGRFLVRRFSFTYLTSGRDLLRVGQGQRAVGNPVIIADPAFDRGVSSPDGGAPRTRGALAPDFQLTSWGRLPGTAAEADALASELPGARVLRGERATESAIKEVRRPSILHIATHGFFLDESDAPSGGELTDDDPLAPRSPAATEAPAAAAAAPPASGADQPLLRSGLVFAGVNHLQSGRDDGVLTALEAASLDLRGTRLVVLSACETGVGEARRGDGVHGLRRAFVLAGAESLVMSLWQVDDEATRDLMIGYYRYLDEGLGRSEALRRVQLETLRTERYEHPYYWASFVPAGDWTPIAD